MLKSSSNWCLKNSSDSRPLVWWLVCMSSGLSGAQSTCCRCLFPLFHLIAVIYCITVNYVVGKHVRRAQDICACTAKIDGFSSDGASAVPLWVFHLIHTLWWCKHLSLWTEKSNVNLHNQKTHKKRCLCSTHTIPSFFFCKLCRRFDRETVWVLFSIMQRLEGQKWRCQKGRNTSVMK